MRYAASGVAALGYTRQRFQGETTLLSWYIYHTFARRLSAAPNLTTNTPPSMLPAAVAASPSAVVPLQGLLARSTLFYTYRFDRNTHAFVLTLCPHSCAPRPGVSPLDDALATHAQMHPGGRYEEITPRSAKRNAFVLCTASRFVNSALRHFKGRMCTEGQPNLEQTLRIS